MKKRCNKCDKTKCIKQFSKRKLSQDGYQSKCKVCEKLYRQSKKSKEIQKRYHQSEKGKKTKERYDNSSRGKEARRKASKKYDQSEKGKQATRRHLQSEKSKQSKKRFGRSDKGKQQSKKDIAIRRARKSQAGGSYTATEWFNLCKFYGFRCLRCDNKFPFEKLAIDHIKPISKDGTSFIWNTQPLCKRCNSKKGNKEIDYRKTLPPWINRDGPVWQQGRLF